MTNVKEEIRDNKLILTIDLSEQHGKSKSGKTVTVATTNGFVPVGAGEFKVIYSLNVNKKG